MSESNGHAPRAVPTVAHSRPPIAFDYRRDDGSIELVKMRPALGHLGLDGAAWTIGGVDVATGERRSFKLTSIVMIYGARGESSKPRPRCLCGAVQKADCGCPSPVHFWGVYTRLPGDSGDWMPTDDVIPADSEQEATLKARTMYQTRNVMVRPAKAGEGGKS